MLTWTVLTRARLTSARLTSARLTRPVPAGRCSLCAVRDRPCCARARASASRPATSPSGSRSTRSTASPRCTCVAEVMRELSVTPEFQILPCSSTNCFWPLVSAVSADPDSRALLATLRRRSCAQDDRRPPCCDDDDRGLTVASPDSCPCGAADESRLEGRGGGRPESSPSTKLLPARGTRPGLQRTVCAVCTALRAARLVRVPSGGVLVVAAPALFADGPRPVAASRRA